MRRRKTARLAFEDGLVLTGEALGATGGTAGEVVFNTSMTGYQEVLTDPSYAGQIVTMTYPLIGNYGVNAEDAESRGLFVAGFVVREASRVVSNWRADQLTLDEYLARHNVVGIQGVDTRSITRHIRQGGAVNAVISTEAGQTDAELVERARGSRHLEGADLVSEVLPAESLTWQEGGSLHVAVYDCGCKRGILRNLAQRGWKVTVIPGSASAQEILAAGPDGVLLSNGPGDPAAVGYAIETTRGLLGRVPVFGICLGHQMLGLALGGKTYKLKFGHHGANHPVMDLRTGQVLITTQNHGFCVDVDSLGGAENVEITHRNLNDQTCEGIAHKRLAAFSVQFHPEAAPGPHDASYLFDRFGEMMAEHRAGRGGEKKV